MGDFEDNNFPLADNPSTVRWMIVSWKIVKKPECDHCIRGNYGLESRQFDHMIQGAVKADVVQKMKDYINMQKDNGSKPNVKGHVLFLTKVIAMKKISDQTGAIIALDDTVPEYNGSDY